MAIIYIVIDDSLEIINTQDIKELKRLMKNMATRQEQFNAKMQEAGELIGKLTDRIATLENAITSETEEITNFKNTLPENVNTDAFDGMVERLRSTVDESEGLEERVAGIFSTGEETKPVTENGETTEVPVEDGIPVVEPVNEEEVEETDDSAPVEETEEISTSTPTTEEVEVNAPSETGVEAEVENTTDVGSASPNDTGTTTEPVTTDNAPVSDNTDIENENA